MVGVNFLKFYLFNFFHVDPPSLIDIQPPVSVMGNLGGQATVFCESQSLSPFEITWHKKIGNFTKNAAIRMDGEIKKGTYTRRVHLDFSLLSKEDTGVYYCVAKNVGGQHNRSVTVRIKSKMILLISVLSKIPKSPRKTNVNSNIFHGLKRCRVNLSAVG